MVSGIAKLIKALQINISLTLWGSVTVTACRYKHLTFVESWSNYY